MQQLQYGRGQLICLRKHRCSRLLDDLRSGEFRRRLSIVSVHDATAGHLCIHYNIGEVIHCMNQPVLRGTKIRSLARHCGHSKIKLSNSAARHSNSRCDGRRGKCFGRQPRQATVSQKSSRMLLRRFEPHSCPPGKRRWRAARRRGAGVTI